MSDTRAWALLRPDGTNPMTFLTLKGEGRPAFYTSIAEAQADATMRCRRHDLRIAIHEVTGFCPLIYGRKVAAYERCDGDWLMVLDATGNRRCYVDPNGFLRRNMVREG